jgi:hypothetical protein
MSAKSGDRHTPGAFGQESIDHVKSGVELNWKLVGNPSSQQHPKRRAGDAADEKAPQA